MSIHSNDSHQVSRREEGYAPSHQLQKLQISLQTCSHPRVTAEADIWMIVTQIMFFKCYEQHNTLLKQSTCLGERNNTKYRNGLWMWFAGWQIKWTMFLSFEWQMMRNGALIGLIDQLRSNVWASHSSLLAADEDGHLSCVPSRSLPVLRETCLLKWAFKMSNS